MTEVFGGEWARDAGAARRRAEAARDRQVQLQQGSSQQQLLAHLAWQNDVLIQQNAVLVSQGERTNELLAYLADLAYAADKQRAASKSTEDVPPAG